MSFTSSFEANLCSPSTSFTWSIWISGNKCSNATPPSQKPKCDQMRMQILSPLIFRVMVFFESKMAWSKVKVVAGFLCLQFLYTFTLWLGALGSDLAAGQNLQKLEPKIREVCPRFLQVSLVTKNFPMLHQMLHRGENQDKENQGFGRAWAGGRRFMWGL